MKGFLSQLFEEAWVRQAYAKSLGVGFALIDKRRPKANKAEVVNLVGDLKDKHVMIIDDMIDTAGTICNAAQSAMDNGAIDVTCVATLILQLASVWLLRSFRFFSLPVVRR